VTYHTHRERAIVVRSEKKQAVDAKTRAKHLEKLETELSKMQNSLNTRRLKTRAQVEAKLERVFSGSFAVYRPCFSIDLQGEDRKMTLDWSYNDEALEALRFRDGIYVLLTNRMDVEQYPPQWALERFKERSAVEARIRDLKSRLKVRPLFVHTDIRIQALVLITVIALQLYSLIEWEAAKAQEKWTALILKREFAGVSILQTHYDDGSIELEWCNVLPHHLRILEQLGLKLIELPDRLEAFTLFPHPFAEGTGAF
jgi:transposase